MPASRAAPISTSGASCRRPSSSRRSSTIAGRTSAPGWCATLLADDARYAEHWISFWNDLLRNEDGVTYFSENAGRKSITPWLLRALQENRRYDRFVATLINPAGPGRPGRLRERRQLARRDERRGDAVDAGGAEHVAGLPRRQPEVRVVPRQLRQQVEAEGRLRAGRLFLARRHAADVPLRPAAGSPHRAGLPLPRLRPDAALEHARGPASRRGRGALHRSAPRPAAADARQPDLAAADGARHRRHRRRDGRRAVEPGAARLARRRLRRARLRHPAPDRARS